MTTDKETAAHLDPATAASVLTDLVREDRIEVRIWRTRVENLFSTALLASFGITAFFLGKVVQPSVEQLRAITLLFDCGLMAVTTVFFFRVRSDLVELRKAQGYRQDLLNSAVNGKIREFQPFNYPPGTQPVMNDTDLIWLFVLSLGLILAKMLAVTLYPAIFLTFIQAH
jgi:hypothetical protein